MVMLTNKKKMRRLTRQISGNFGGATGRTLLTLAMAGVLVAPVAPGLVSTASGAHITELNSQANWVDADWIGNTLATTVTFSGNDAMPSLDVVVKDLAPPFTHGATRGALLTITSSATGEFYNSGRDYKYHDVSLAFHNTLLFDDIIISGSTELTSAGLRAADATLVLTGEAKINNLDIGDPTTHGNGIFRIEAAELQHTTLTSHKTMVHSKGVLSFKSIVNANDALMTATHQGHVELYGGSLQAASPAGEKTVSNTVKGNVIARGADSPQVVPLLTSSISKSNPGAKLSIMGELWLRAAGQNYAALTLDSGITVSLGVEDVAQPGKKASIVSGNGLIGNTLNLKGSLVAAGVSKKTPMIGKDDELLAGKDGDLVVSKVTLNIEGSQLHAPLLGIYDSRVNIARNFLIGGKTDGLRVSSLVLGGEKLKDDSGLSEDYSGAGTLALVRGSKLTVHNATQATDAILTSGANGSAIYGDVAFDKGILNLKKDKLTVYATLDNYDGALPSNAPLGNVTITERTVLQGHKEETNPGASFSFFIPNYSQLVTGTLTVKHSSDTDKPVTFGAAIQPNGEGTQFNLTVDRLDLQSSKTTLLGADPATSKSSLLTMTNLTITGGSDATKDFLSSSTTPREFIISGIMYEDASPAFLGSYSVLTLDAGNALRRGTSKHTITVDAPPMIPAFMVSQGNWTVAKLNMNGGEASIGNEFEDETGKPFYTSAVLYISEKNGLTLAADTMLHVLPGSTLSLTQVGPLVVGKDGFKGVIMLHGKNGEAATLLTSDLTASADIFGPVSGAQPGVWFSSDDKLNVSGKLTLTPGTGGPGGGGQRSGGSDIEIGAVATISVKTMAALDGDSKPTGLIVNSQADPYNFTTLTLNISGAGKNASFLDATSLAFDSNGTLNLRSNDATNGGGIFAGAVTQSDGTIHVQKGHWTLGSLEQHALPAIDPDEHGDGGYDGTAGGFAHISGGSLTIGGLTNVAYGTGTDKITGSYSFGVLVDGSGVLKGDNAVFVTKSGSTYVAADDVEKILVNGSGVLELKWDGTTLTRAERKAIKESLMLADSTGLIKYEGAKIEAADAIIKDDVALNGSYNADVAQGSGELLTGTTVGAVGTAEGTNTKVSTGGFGADSLLIKDNGSAKTASVTVSGNNLTLTGAAGKGLVEVRNADGSVNAEASQNVSINAGTSVLNIGSAADTAGSGALKGVTVAGGSLNVANGTFQISSIDMTSGTAGAMTVDAKANLETDDIKLTSGANGAGNTLAVQGNSTLTAKTLVASANDRITVGNTDAAGSLSVENAEFGGATIFTDPAWKDGQAITDASKMAVGGSTVTGKFVVGQNSWVSMGNTDLAWLPNVVTDANVMWGAGHVTAALGIYRPQILQANNGGIKVDGSLTSKTTPTPSVNVNEAVFASQSLLVVNAPGMGGQAALTAVSGTGGLLSVAAGAQLLLVDGTLGSTYTIASGFTNAATAIANGGWEKGNLLAASRLQGLTLDKSTVGTVKVTVGSKSASDALPGISDGLGNFLNGFEWAGLNDMDSPNAGIAFISRLTSNLNGLSDREVLSVLESSTQTALAGGAPSASFDSVAVATRAMGERTGIATPNNNLGYSSGDSAHSFGVWGVPLFRSSEISHQKSGSFKYSVDNKLYGGIIGVDVTNPMLSGDFRVGAALNVGTGDTKSRGGLSKTKNDYDYWGASVYAGYRQENFSLSADLGFNSTSSSIKQDIPVTLGMGGQLNSKVDAKSYTVGLQAEYLFPMSAMDITPYVGMRYIAYRQDAYNVNSQPGTVFHMGKASMDTFTFPIGVKFSREMELSNGWNITPELNLAIVPALGDTKLTSKARIPGVNLSPASMTGHVFDGVTGEVGLGLRIVKENMSLGLNYDFQGGSHQRAHSLSAQLRYAF